MDLLSLFSGCALIISAQCSPSAAPAQPQKGIAQWQPMVAKAASTFALPEAWLNAVMTRESGGKTMLNGRPITSSAGAMGLMQVMPRTYSDLRKQLGLGADPYAPADNITAGAAYLQQMYRRYGYPGMFAAYNAGPERFEAYIRDGENLPAETWHYLGKLGPGIAETVIAMGSVPLPIRPAMASRSVDLPLPFSPTKTVMALSNWNSKSPLW